MVIAVLYHDDSDGFGAAYALSTSLPADTTYIPVQYGQPVPELPVGVDRLLIVDFSYDRETCEHLASKFEPGRFCILDHHKTAEVALSGLQYARFDQTKSGAILAWEFAKPDTEPPEILRYVQDRDLWKFELEDSEAVNAYIATLPNSFDVWAAFDLENAKRSGNAILAFRDRQIEQAFGRVCISTVAGFSVPVVNASDNISELGNALCKRFPDAPFSASYCDRADGKRSYSLRSIGSFDVSVVAKGFGGGGHRNAAGFSVQTPAPSGV